MAQLKNPLDIYKLLPKTNCRRCYRLTCLAFAAAVVKGEKQLADCPYVEVGAGGQITARVQVREPFGQQREKQLAALRRAVSTLDFAARAGPLGARFEKGRLTVKSLGKDFQIEQSGHVTSECHTHAGLTIPLLGYIVYSNGTDVAGRWIPFRELKKGAPMAALFTRRGEMALKVLADSHTELFEDLVSIFSGQLASEAFEADIAIILSPLPKLPVLICYWKPEEDLASELSIFFDVTADQHLAIESIFELGVGLVMMFQKIVQKHI
jgi:hypothetical protein